MVDEELDPLGLSLSLFKGMMYKKGWNPTGRIDGLGIIIAHVSYHTVKGEIYDASHSRSLLLALLLPLHYSKARLL